ncbi:uncharacterized protein LOC109098296 [Cyprinus carpio]|uniref:Uncharacterized protein LOC109098296 n=1 Tax=Cyprinus carpio TaxID=7962 RepID=A0A9Q9ZJF9_CYPCA|nr:uncharacterized protein LOC109098296 [Cyprinus carpio]
MNVKPGDNITLFCDRSVTFGSSIVWIRNCSHENQPSLIIDFRKLDEEIFQRFSFIHNLYNNSYDLHITNISVSDLGLYYCAKLQMKVNEDGKGILSQSEVYYYGNQTTRLSLKVNSCSGPLNTTSTPPPVSDCLLCWTLLFSVCPVCCLFSSICVFCLCCRKTTDSATDQKLKQKGRNIIEENYDTEVCYASVDLMTRRQNRHKKTQAPSSDFTTYAPIRTEAE